MSPNAQHARQIQLPRWPALSRLPALATLARRAASTHRTPDQVVQTTRQTLYAQIFCQYLRVANTCRGIPSPELLTTVAFAVAAPPRARRAPPDSTRHQRAIKRALTAE